MAMKTKVMFILWALLLGAVVVGVHPAYRKALVAIAGGKPAESPIWQANKDYYPDVSLPDAPAAALAAETAPAI